MILKTRAGDKVLREATLGTLIDAATGGLRGGAGVPVNASSVGGVPAAKECIRLAAEAVAMLELGVYRGRDIERRPVTTTWQSRFFSSPTCDSEYTPWFRMKEWTEASLTGRHNAFWLKEKDALGRVAGVCFLHADTVECDWDTRARKPIYRYLQADGRWSSWVDSRTILHFRVGHVAPGAVRAPSPIEMHREVLRTMISKQRYEGNMYKDGVLQSIAVVLADGVDPDQAERFGRVFREQHGGVDNAPKVKVFGGTQDIKTVGLSLQDAQYIEGMQFSVDECARVYGVTASLVQGGTQASKPISPEHEQTRWHRYGLEPRLARFTSSINADPDFFGPASRDYIMFSDTAVRADVAVERAADVSDVQAGILLQDEARAKRGLPPLPGGAGKIPQTTPVGGAPTEAPAPPAPAEDDQEDA